MDSIDKTLIMIVAIIAFVFALIGLSMGVAVDSKQQELKERVLVLETKMNIYSGQAGCN